MRPKSLAEVAALTLQGDSFDRCLANFLDGFYSAPNSVSLDQEPATLAEKNGKEGRVQDAYLAATAEELARRYGLGVPSWTMSPGRSLEWPWFASSLASLRGVLIVESPAGFRSRNLFVSENALSRV